MQPARAAARAAATVDAHCAVKMLSESERSLLSVPFYTFWFGLTIFRNLLTLGMATSTLVFRILCRWDVAGLHPHSRISLIPLTWYS